MHAPFKMEAPRQTRNAVGLRDAVLWTVVSIFVFFLVDAALFRSGWYLQFVEPNSTAGLVELRFRSLTSEVSSHPDVLVIGDSRVAEGFSARTAAAAIDNHFQFENAGIGGASPRDWYYLLRDSDPTTRKFAAIILSLDEYADQDVENLSDRVADLNYLIGRLRITDCVPFARSFDDPSLRLQIFTGCLFKGITLRRDLKDLFIHYHSRISSAEAWRKDGAGWQDAYGGKPENVSGITADWANKRLNFPSRLSDVQKGSIQWTVMPPEVPQTGALSRYRELWLGHILDLYKNSSTRIIFVEMPRAPLLRPDSTIPARFIDSIRGQRDVDVVSPSTFRDLERPDLFADGFHLNHVGQKIFSERLALTVTNILGGR